MKKQILSIIAFAVLLVSPINVFAQAKTTIYLTGLLETHDGLLEGHGDMDFASVTKRDITGLSGSMKALFWDPNKEALITQPNAITAIHSNFNEARVGNLLAQLMYDFLPKDYDKSVLTGLPKAKMTSKPSVGRGGQDGIWKFTFKAKKGYQFSNGTDTYTFSVVILTQK